MTLKALIFDVDGTLAETEEAHRTAFNRTFAASGWAGIGLSMNTRIFWKQLVAKNGCVVTATTWEHRNQAKRES